jgi:hypothetical protein
MQSAYEEMLADRYWYGTRIEFYCSNDNFDDNFIYHWITINFFDNIPHWRNLLGN